MADISKIKLPNNSEYDFKDSAGRKEAYLEWGGRSLTASIAPVSMSISAEHNANRIAFLNPAAISIEYTTNGGSTWTDSGYADSEKMWLCTGTQFIAVGQSKANYSASTALTTSHWTRVTLTGQNGTTGYVYTDPRKLLIYMSTALTVDCLIEYKTGVSGAEWKTFGTYPVAGWSGWNDIPLILSTFGGGTTQTSNNWYLRFTFKVTSTRTDNYKGYSGIYGLRLFGANNWTTASVQNNKGYMSSTGHLYSYDANANATFPAIVTANGGFVGNASSSSALVLNTQVTGNTINDFRGAQIKAASVKSITITGLAGSDGIVIWIPWNANYGRQLIFDDTTQKVFSRYYNNGTWGSWESFAILNTTDANAFMNALTTGSSDPVDADYYIAQYAGGGTSTTTYHRRPHSALWNYIKGKISSILGLTATNYGGTSAKATADASGNTITTHYAPKSTAVTNVALATNKITKTINGTTTDVVTAATTSAYGITKLNSATNSTSTTEAATPSAVRAAYNLADDANTVAGQAYSLGTGALVYDQTYTMSNTGVATFYPHVYQGGQEITTSYDKNHFVWKARILNSRTNPITVSEVVIPTNNDRTCTVTLSTYGYGVTIIGTFTT